LHRRSWTLTSQEEEDSEEEEGHPQKEEDTHQEKAPEGCSQPSCY